MAEHITVGILTPFRSICSRSQALVGSRCRTCSILQPLHHRHRRGFSDTALRLQKQTQTVQQSPQAHSTLTTQHNGRHLGFNHSLRRLVRTQYPGYQAFRYKSKYAESSQNPLAGLWKPTHLQRLYYGPNSVRDNLLDCLPTKSSKAFVLTGSSLANKTSLIKQVEEQLGSRHASTFSKIGQHAPIKELDEATELVLKDDAIDTIISIGGGSPIDSAKAISYRLNERTKGKFLYHITIPTTLSAAECTLGAGYTGADGIKTGVAHPELAPHVIIYDSKFALETPPWLWMSTGMRAMDHAMELMYHPTSTEMPCRQMAVQAAAGLFENLPKYKQNPKDEQVITKLQLAAFSSLGFLALNVKGALGLSHTLGYALGSPYQIPHGITSCLTLGHVVKLKAQGSKEDAAQIARMAPFIGIAKSGDDRKDAVAVGDAILGLVRDLGLKTTLTEKGVGRDQVHTIVKLATRQEEGPQYDAVQGLVEGLY